MEIFEKAIFLILSTQPSVSNKPLSREATNSKSACINEGWMYLLFPSSTPHLQRNSLNHFFFDKTKLIDPNRLTLLLKGSNLLAVFSISSIDSKSPLVKVGLPL